MINEENEKFKYKIDSKYFLIKIYIAKDIINIIVTVTSENNLYDTEYINNYTLSHLQEINNYFKIFNNIKDIYYDLLRIIKRKDFTSIENEDETLSFILKIKINNNIRNIKLTLTQNKKYDKNKDNKINENNMQDIYYELNVLNNRLNSLEESKHLLTNSNKYNIKQSISYPNERYNQMEEMMSKMHKLENEVNNKTIKINMLQEKLDLIRKKNNNNIYSKYINKSKILNNIDNNINDNNNINYNNGIYNYSVYSDNFKINKNRKNNLKSIRPYNSMDKNRHIENINIFRNNNNHNNYKYRLSSDLKYNNKKKLNMSYIKYDEYNNNIPIVKRENILNLNSRIFFTNKEVQLLIKKMTKDNNIKNVSLKLLYRASKDGDCEEILKTKCNNQLNKLTLFYTMEGARFGVYTEKNIKKSFSKGYVLYEIPGTSFIISLNNLIYYNVMAKKTSLYKESDNNLCFGWCSKINNNKTNWLIYTSRNNFLGKKFLFGNKNDVYLNLDYKKIVGDNPSYTIKDIEIFAVINKNI